MKVAALDLGSNSFLCLIAEVNRGRVQKIISDQMEMVRLGQGLGKGSGPKSFHPEALARADQCLKKYAETIKFHKPDHILAMATAAARDVANADELIVLGNKYQIPIQIIPGEKEAQITYQGAISGLDLRSDESLAVLDIGGGSTELIVGQGSKLLFGKSFNFGCVKLRERFLMNMPASQGDLRQAEQFIKNEINSILPQLKTVGMAQKLVAVAGTVTELARVSLGGGEFDTTKIDGMYFSKEDLNTWYERFAKASKQQMIDVYKVDSGRADLLLPGVMALLQFCQVLSLPGLSVSTRGVRFGVAIEIEKRHAQG